MCIVKHCQPQIHTFDDGFLLALERLADQLAAKPQQDFYAVPSPEGGFTVALRPL